MRTRWKASDLPDAVVLAAIEKLSNDHSWSYLHPRWVLFHEVAERFSYAPPKVVRAKLRRLILKGKLCGCWCGCRGDFHLP